MTTQNRRRKYTPSEWNAKKAVIKDLYLSQDLKLSEVQEVMRHRHNFDARYRSKVELFILANRRSIQMYKARFTRWHWEKNKNGKLRVAAHRRRQEQDRKGKRNTFLYRGYRFNDENVDEYYKRRNEYNQKEGVNYPSPSSSMANDLQCMTPELEDLTAIALSLPSTVRGVRDVDGGSEIAEELGAARAASLSPWDVHGESDMTFGTTAHIPGQPSNKNLNSLHGGTSLTLPEELPTLKSAWNVSRQRSMQQNPSEKSLCSIDELPLQMPGETLATTLDGVLRPSSVSQLAQESTFQSVSEENSGEISTQMTTRSGALQRTPNASSLQWRMYGRTSQSPARPMFSRDPETMTQSIIHSLTNMFTSYFQCGEWFSIGLQQSCRSLGLNHVSASNKGAIYFDVLASVNICLYHAEREKPAHAVAYLNRACEDLMTALVENAPSFILNLLQDLMLYCHSQSKVVRCLQRSFFSYFGECASVVHESAYHPSVQLASFLIQHSHNPQILRTLHKVTQHLFEQFLSRSHLQSLQAQLAGLKTFREEQSIPVVEAFLEAVRTCLGDHHWLYRSALQLLCRLYFNSERFQDIKILLAGLLSKPQKSYVNIPSMIYLAEAQFALAEDDEALATIRAAFKFIIHDYQVDLIFTRSNTCFALREFAKLLRRYGRTDEAAPFYNMLHQIEDEEQEVVTKELEKLALNASSDMQEGTTFDT